MMEFQSPPTSLTEAEEAAREEFDKRLDFVQDLRIAEEFLKHFWPHTALSMVPLEIKFHILEEDPIKALAEFEDRSAFLASKHEPDDGFRFSAFGHRHENTTQHFAKLAFGHGRVQYVVVWIEQDAEVAE